MLTDQGKKCAFPFTIPALNNKIYKSCTADLLGRDGKVWCPHSVDDNGGANLADYGFCDKPCQEGKKS